MTYNYNSKSAGHFAEVALSLLPLFTQSFFPERNERKSISKVVVSVGKYIVCEKKTFVEKGVTNAHFINDFCFGQKKIRSG